ncbi:hypothetical protein Pcinc_035325 [Petrolisthes cinctipes]|uniref:Uncharacterized protein n=1 Tax=Petrolisthes cinctipes TaxID=88211 RepID=A0AAE1BYJ1_PETCI|nr:hypothetical protein Pcinc_035325 [Petrolisthes cinctipes]
MDSSTLPRSQQVSGSRQVAVPLITMESTSGATKDTQGTTYSFTTFSPSLSLAKQKFREHLGLPAYKEGEPRTIYIKKMSKEGKVFQVPKGPSHTQKRENTMDSQLSVATLTAIDDIMKQAERELEDERREEHPEDQRREKYSEDQRREKYPEDQRREKNPEDQSIVWQLENERRVTELEDARKVVHPPGKNDKSNEIQSVVVNEEIVGVAGPSKRRRRKKKKRKVTEQNRKDEGPCQIVEHIEACTSLNRQKPANQPGTTRSDISHKKRPRKQRKNKDVTSDNILLDRQEPNLVPLADALLGSGCLYPEPDGDDECVILEVIQSPPGTSKKRKDLPEDCEQQNQGKKIKSVSNISEDRSKQDQGKSHETVNSIQETNSLEISITIDNYTDEKNIQQAQGEKIGAASHTSIYETESQQNQEKQSKSINLILETPCQLDQGTKINYLNSICKNNSQNSTSIGSTGDSHSHVQSPCKQDISSCTEAELLPPTDQPRRIRKRQRRKTSITKLSRALRNNEPERQGSCVASTSRKNCRWSSHPRMSASKEYVDVCSLGESSNTDIECCKTSVGKTQASVLLTVDDYKNVLPHSLEKRECFVIVEEECKEFDATSTYTIDQNQEVLDTNISPNKEVSSDKLNSNKVAALSAATSESSCDPNSSSSVMDITSSSSLPTGSESISSISFVEATPLPVTKKKGIISDSVQSIFCTKPQMKSNCDTHKNENKEKPVLRKINVEEQEVQDRDGKPQDRRLEAKMLEGESKVEEICPLLQEEMEKTEEHHINTNNTQASDISSISSSSTEVLKPEGETCLRAVLQVFQEHFGGSKEDNLRLLQKNSFNLLTSLVEMQSLHPHSKKTPSTIDLEETGAMGAEGTVHPSLPHLGDKSQDLSV